MLSNMILNIVIFLVLPTILTAAEREAIKQLKTRNNIIIKPGDKGSETFVKGK